MHRQIYNAACAAFLAVPLAGCQTPGQNSGPIVYRRPILETVVQNNAGLRILSEAPDSSYTIPSRPALLRFRVQGDVNLKVLVDGGALPRRAQATADSGWYEPSGSPLKSGSRNFFWDIAVELPSRVFLASVAAVAVTFDYETASAAQQPRLDVKLRLEGRDPSYAQAMRRPSDVFVGTTDNTKDRGRMETSIVARGVTLAGWLFDPNRNKGVVPGKSNVSEDWHYDLYLDPDFLERNYGSSGQADSVMSAILPGNLWGADNPTAPPIPLFSPNQTSRHMAAALTLPGAQFMTVELNAWHKSVRGVRPGFWQDDPDLPAFSENAWPFNPYKGSANLGLGPDLQAGDYVIVSGTLWQDNRHHQGLGPCIENRLLGHGGWLELHPVDAVRREYTGPPLPKLPDMPSAAETLKYEDDLRKFRLNWLGRPDRPQPRKHVIGYAACFPSTISTDGSFDHLIEHPDLPPDKTWQLRFEVIVDERFTTSNAVHTEALDPTCNIPMLNITASVPGPGSFNAIYILWWEKTNQHSQGVTDCVPR